MKRIGGKVTWMCEFEGPMADLAACGIKRTTLRRCHIVEPGDTLRLANADTGRVFSEVEVTRVRPITIGVGERKGRMTCWADLDGSKLTKEQLDELAVADGFGCARELVDWLEARGKFFAGLYDGQLIEW